MGYTPIEGIRNVETNKVFAMKGTSYKPGDRVDVSGLDSHKVTQLLNQRVLRPANPKSPG